VKSRRLTTSQNVNAHHLDVYQSRIELYARAACGGEDAAPIRVAAAKAVFTSGEVGDCFGDSFRRGASVFAWLLFDFDHALRAFAIGNDLQRARAADFFEAQVVNARCADVPALIAGAPASRSRERAGCRSSKCRHPR